MHPDVAALLAVQDDDVDHSRPRDAARRAAAAARRAWRRSATRRVAALQQARKIAESEERRRQEVAARVAQHRALQEKNQTALNSVTSMREATAATAQLEQAKRMIDEDERELAAIGQRLVEANRVVDERERDRRRAGNGAGAGARVARRPTSRRIEAQARRARARFARTRRASVPRALLSTYDRIRSRKRVHAVFPLRGNSCGNCDTMIPLQRRSIMTAHGRHGNLRRLRRDVVRDGLMVVGGGSGQ